MRALHGRRWVTTVHVGAVWCMAAPLAMAQSPSFVDASKQAGLSVVHSPASATIQWQAWQTGGAAAGDFDRDGLTDLFVVSGGGGPDHLFMNQGDGTFVDEAQAWGLVDLHAGNGAAVVQQELAAIGEAVSARVTKLSDSLKQIADEFSDVEIGRDTPKEVLNELLARYPKTDEVKG